MKAMRREVRSASKRGEEIEKRSRNVIMGDLCRHFLKVRLWEDGGLKCMI
jgi:hypothetical protein